TAGRRNPAGFRSPHPDRSQERGRKQRCKGGPREQLPLEDASVNPDCQLRERRIVGVDRDCSVKAPRVKGFGTKADVDSKGAARPRRRRDANGERVHIRANGSKAKLSFALLDERRLLEKGGGVRLPPDAIERDLAEVDLSGTDIEIRLDED